MNRRPRRNRKPREIRICPVCHGTFGVLHSSPQKTCSRECAARHVGGLNQERAKLRIDTRTCIHCQREFITQKKSTQKLCSSKCARIWTAGLLTKDRQKRICKHCGNEFDVIVSSRQVLCSKQCRDNSGVDNLSLELPTPIEQDAAFCAAMEAAGYKKTGPRKKPCTLDPIDLTRNYRPAVRQYGWDVTGW